MRAIDQIVAEAQGAIQQANDVPALLRVKAQFLGKKSQLTDLLSQLSTMLPAERPQFGQAINHAKKQLQQAVKAREQDLKKQHLNQKLAAESIDVSLPGRGRAMGSLHPITSVRHRVESIFQHIGFTVVEGPEIETEEYNFNALNIPDHHPARQMQDTFYLQDGRVLRTHTSPVQARTLEKHSLPLRIIVPGRTYRHDFDVTHTPMFHQVEGLLVDESVNFAQLKGVLIEFAQRFFQQNLATRFRPSYFPFTEPSAEMDIECVICHGEDPQCRVCKGTGWLEVLGCGMVHPNVLRYANVDSEQYTGFAFGIGLDRMAMLFYGIKDLRMMFENDIRFLRQF
ncbi:MAG: phenylalanine--tRNA ligase subunit alpha [Pseudomonadota bacterium]